jgi:uncharacterized OsmC-like protein
MGTGRKRCATLQAQLGSIRIRHRYDKHNAGEALPAGRRQDLSAPSPGWYLSAALASCTAIGITMRAAQLGIALRELEVSVCARVDFRGWFGLADVSSALSELRAQVRIGADGVSAQQLHELVEWCAAHLAVNATVRAGPKIELEVEIV